MSGKPQQDGAISPGARASVLLKALGTGIRTGQDSDARTELVKLFTLLENQQKQITALERRIAALEQERAND
ncbi:MAG: hypothetical protein QM758_26855 [Armatimonas sp.]